MRRPAYLLFIPFASLLVPGRVTAQGYVQEALAGFEALVSQDGFSRMMDIQEGMLREGNDSRFAVELQAGWEYRIVGFCDEDCSDLDLLLLDPYGDVIEEDVLVDAEPLLAFNADMDGRYEVQVSMVSCSLEPCGYGVGVYAVSLEGQEEGWGGFPGAQGVQDALLIMAGELAEEGYVQAGEILSGWLDAGQQEVQYVGLRSGASYQIWGMCDLDCDDLDLTIYDPSGTQVDQDILVDDVPVLEFVASGSGDYRIDVSMVTCSVEPCEYGVIVLQQGGGGGGKQVASGKSTGGSRAGAGEVLSEVTHIGVLEAGDSRRADGEYFDRYLVELEAGQHVTVDMTSEEIDTYLILISPSYERYENDDFGDNTDSGLEMVVPESGEWEIQASSFSSETSGEYTVKITVREGD